MLSSPRATSTPAPATGPVTDVAAVALREVRRTFDSAKGPFVALEGVTLTVPRSQFLSVVGPSGCGKSTLLSLISGLGAADEGHVEVMGEPVKGVQSDVGYIFQKDALLPWRTALQNVALGPMFRGTKKAKALDQARSWLARVGLSKHQDSYPHQLSGGMRKRVAIAATMVCEPAVLLMDEPFSALDVQTRTIMENDLLELWELARPTVIFITHDLEEAIGLSDRVVVMAASPGRVIGDYEIPLARPRNLLDIRMDPAFTVLYERIWEQLRQEVVNSGDH